MKNMKKLVALFAATVMTMSIGVSAFAATINYDETGASTDASGEKVFNLVFTPGENEAAQLTMIAYLVEGETWEAYDGHEVVAIDQVGGSEGFGSVPVDTEKLKEGYSIAVAIGGTGVAADEITTALVTYDEESGTVILYGDCYKDGQITVADSITLLQHLAEMSVDIDLAAADVYYDNQITVADSITLLQYLADMDVTLGPVED